MCVNQFSHQNVSHSKIHCTFYLLWISLQNGSSLIFSIWNENDVIARLDESDFCGKTFLQQCAPSLQWKHSSGGAPTWKQWRKYPWTWSFFGLLDFYVTISEKLYKNWLPLSSGCAAPLSGSTGCFICMQHNFSYLLLQQSIMYSEDFSWRTKKYYSFKIAN